MLLIKATLLSVIISKYEQISLSVWTIQACVNTMSTISPQISLQTSVGILNIKVNDSEIGKNTERVWIALKGCQERALSL